MTSPGACLSVRHLSVERDGKPILCDISLDVHPGEWTSILGPNGAGKSTLLKTILGLYPPTRGKITLMGRPLNAYAPKQRARLLATVPQGGASDTLMPLNEFCTVREWVLLGRYPYQNWFQAPSRQDESVANTLLSQMGLESFSERRIHTLSGGERQKVLIAAALAQEPHILLLDEPATFLDPKNQAEIQALLLQIHRHREVAFLVVTHDINAALQSSQRIIGLKQGALAFEGNPAACACPIRLESLYGVPFQAIAPPDGAQPPILMPIPSKTPSSQAAGRLHDG